MEPISHRHASVGFARFTHTRLIQLANSLKLNQINQVLNMVLIISNTTFWPPAIHIHFRASHVNEKPLRHTFTSCFSRTGFHKPSANFRCAFFALGVGCLWNEGKQAHASCRGIIDRRPTIVLLYRFDVI